MKLFDLLAQQSQNRHTRWVIRQNARRGNPMPMPTFWDRLDARFVIAIIIIGMFALAFLREHDRDTKNLMVGALIAGFAGAWGYFLGSSSGAANAGARQEQALALSHELVKALPAPPAADVQLEPGQSAKVEARDA